MKYIMVTDFDNHWANIPGNFTSYSSNMVKLKVTKDKYIPGTETLFIKKLKYSDEIEKAWLGKVLDINILPGKIFFRVEIYNETPCPKAYSLLDNGWYFEFDKLI
jgi:hypothetical protein